MKKGFTLIETLIYIALFSLLLGGAFVITYQLIESSGKLSIKNTIQNEGNFVMRKLSWALTGVDYTITTTPTSGNSPTNRLVVTKYNGNKITMQLNGTKIEMKESANDNTFLAITTDNVVVSSLSFQYETLGGITATAIIDGVTFTTTKYFRK
ncbi:MAG: prepilin-type N-terminal cleavage/methylation domain-containing protein [Candidatus Pacebacteria bacterium]|nr:prepilin-type N-terminal cleavage/methylation domain-containing protein [Candidatus Paceibacterota bacterium]